MLFRSRTSPPAPHTPSPPYDISMMSYLTSTPQPSPSASMSSQSSNDSVAALVKYKKELTALPASLFISSSSSTFRKKNKSSKSLVSKTFNVVGPRPSANIAYKPQILTAYLRLSVASQFSTSATVPTMQATYYTLASFFSYTEYTGLFDQYRFDQLEWWIEPQASQSLTSTNVGNLVTAIDLDDATTPANFDAVAVKQNSISSVGNDGHYHKFQPHMAVASYAGAFTSYSNVTPTWIDSGSPSVQHYGVKIAASATTAIQVYNIQVRARVSFRNAGI